MEGTRVNGDENTQCVMNVRKFRIETRLTKRGVRLYDQWAMGIKNNNEAEATSRNAYHIPCPT
jgi:hypothetical protein